MPVVVLERKPTSEQLKEMKKEFGSYIKLAVDVRKEILAGGGKLHADCEKILLERGSSQKDIWGGGYDLETGDIDCVAIINIRPVQQNPSEEILDKNIRVGFFQVVEGIFKGK